MPKAKNTNTGKNGAPLWVWLAAATVALVFIGVSYHSFLQICYFDQFNPKRLERFAQPGAEKALKIAVIGTSLTRNALYKDEDMDRLAKDRGMNIRFLRFTLDGGRLGNFYDLSEEVVHSKADIIFFEAALFGLDRGDVDEIWARHRRSLRHEAVDLLTRLPFVPEKRRSQEINANYTTIEISPVPFSGKNQEKETGLYLKRVSRFRIRDFSEGKRFAALFRLARARGKVVEFLDLSRSREAWAMLPANFEDLFDATMANYEKVYGIRYLRFPYRLPIEYFEDFAHFGTTGRKFYSAWFLTNLAAPSGDAGK